MNEGEVRKFRRLEPKLVVAIATSLSDRKSSDRSFESSHSRVYLY